jgi:hypothetical protein
MRLTQQQMLIAAFVAGCVATYLVLKMSKQFDGFQGSENACPDLSNYMLKTECPPVPDLTQYVLKSSIPPPQPIIIDTSADTEKKCGECPPCPRPRCPEVKCPPPTICPACPPCARPSCPQTVVKCKAEDSDTPIRPFLAPLSSPAFSSS